MNAAVFDLLCGLGVLLPSLTSIKPRLAVLGAVGCVGPMASAVALHVKRGEGASTPFNFVLAALAAFVAWGRQGREPIAPRA